jgi:catechol 2,3-dioxygenase-like lactoylglutathione lyase family enzyme
MVEFAVPILPATDLDATLAFYARLGFENAGSAPSEWNYLIIRRGNIQLHFYGDPGIDPPTTSSSCYVFTEDADALFDAWNEIGVATDPKTGSRLQGPSVDTDYGMREFALVDPSGNLIRVGSPPSSEQSSTGPGHREDKRHSARLVLMDLWPHLPTLGRLSRQVL